MGSVHYKTPQVTGANKTDFLPQMTTKYTELYPTRLYPHPLEDAKRDAGYRYHKTNA